MAFAVSVLDIANKSTKKQSRRFIKSLKVAIHLQDNGVDSVIDVEMDADFQYVMLSMKGGILFQSGSADKH